MAIKRTPGRSVVGIRDGKKIKFVLEQDMKAQRGSRNIVLLFL
jgi:hypothetical protein